ncbi:hypothetical protein ACQPT2_03385 [Erwinia amylovora]
MNRSGQEVLTFSPGGRQREVSAASLEKNARPRHNLLRLHLPCGPLPIFLSSSVKPILPLFAGFSPLRNP